MSRRRNSTSAMTIAAVLTTTAVVGGLAYAASRPKKKEETKKKASKPLNLITVTTQAEWDAVVSKLLGEGTVVLSVSGDVKPLEGALTSIARTYGSGDVVTVVDPMTKAQEKIVPFAGAKLAVVQLNGTVATLTNVAGGNLQTKPVPGTSGMIGFARYEGEDGEIMLELATPVDKLPTFEVQAVEPTTPTSAVVVIPVSVYKAMVAARVSAFTGDDAEQALAEVDEQLASILGDDVVVPVPYASTAEGVKKLNEAMTKGFSKASDATESTLPGSKLNIPAMAFNDLTVGFAFATAPGVVDLVATLVVALSMLGDDAPDMILVDQEPGVDCTASKDIAKGRVIYQATGEVDEATGKCIFEKMPMAPAIEEYRSFIEAAQSVVEEGGIAVFKSDTQATGGPMPENTLAASRRNLDGSTAASIQGELQQSTVLLGNVAGFRGSPTLWVEVSAGDVLDDIVQGISTPELPSDRSRLFGPLGVKILVNPNSPGFLVHFFNGNKSELTVNAYWAYVFLAYPDPNMSGDIAVLEPAVFLFDTEDAMVQFFTEPTDGRDRPLTQWQIVVRDLMSDAKMFFEAAPPLEGLPNPREMQP
jgi:hypothetical protein